MTTTLGPPPALTEGSTPRAVRGWNWFWRLALVVVGAAAGFAVVWTHPDRGHESWYAWAALGTMLGGVSGWSFGSGIARYRDVVALQPVRAIRILPALVLMGLSVGVALALYFVVVGPSVIAQGLALAGVSGVGALPVGAAVVAIRVLSIDGVVGTAGRRLDSLLRLRRLLSSLNAMFGMLVVSVTLYMAAQRLLASEKEVPASLVIYTGVAAAVVVASVYLPTAAVLRRRCRMFIDEEFSLDNVDREHLIQAAEDRHRLEVLLGLHRTTLAELQNALVIVAPLLAGAGSALLSVF